MNLNYSHETYNKNQTPLFRDKGNRLMGHNILLIGPPGSGKTMLSERLPSIMPPLTTQKALEQIGRASCRERV